jgi:general secretion pathway protein I
MTRATTARRRRAGFTLLEVMVAVAILGIALTAILSSEVGALRIGNHARRTNVATLLARCKMAELEEQVANEGLPAIDDHGDDECCEDAEVPGYSCEWSLERIILPEMGGTGGLPGQEGAEGEDDEADPMAAAAATDDPLSAAASMAGGGSMDGITQMAMQIAYPTLKPTLEESVRRATVTVHWSEGNRDMSFDVLQYIVSDQGASQDDDGTGGTNTGDGAGTTQ